MTVAELREMLLMYPDYMDVYHADSDVEGFPVHTISVNEVYIDGESRTILELD